MDSQLTILIIEDDEMDIGLLKTALRRAGVKDPVFVVNNGEEAIKYLRGEGQYHDRRQSPFLNVIFSDIKMPRLDGFGVLKWLRSHPECAVIPIIILSNSGEDIDVRRAYEMGANAYLIKPSTIQELQEMVKTAFEFWKWCAKPHIPEKC